MRVRALWTDPGIGGNVPRMAKSEVSLAIGGVDQVGNQVPCGRSVPERSLQPHGPLIAADVVKRSVECVRALRICELASKRDRSRSAV